MKHRRQSEHDPNYLVRKYDRWGNINPEWKVAYQKKLKLKGRRPKKPKL
jgi:hypothetical protein